MSAKAYTLKEACEVLHISMNFLRKKVKAGEVKASIVGKKYLITEKELEKKAKEGLK